MNHGGAMKSLAKARMLCVLGSTLALAGCTLSGAPSFYLFGAYFPAWLLCGVVGIIVAMGVRIAMVIAGIGGALPFPFFVCSSIGLMAAIGSWLALFG